MKLIKAFVRTRKIDEVLCGFREVGVPGITVSSVRGVGYGYKQHLSGLAPCDLSTMEEARKVEIVCRAEQIDELLQAIAASARTGYEGDGIVFVTSVDQAMKIRTGEVGPEAL